MIETAPPVEWTRRRLRFDAKFNPVKSDLWLPDETDVSFVPMEAVGEYGGLQLDQIRQICDVYTGYTYFADGDLCIAKITPCFENGKGALAAGLTNGIGFGTTELHVVRPAETLDVRFLFYISIAADFRGFGAAEMLGAGGQKRIPERFLKDWRAPLPALETQQRIAAFLDEKTAQIDALIARKAALLERLSEKRQAIITQAVTKGLNPAAPLKDSGIDWLGQIPAHWEVVALGYRYEVQLGRMLNAERAEGDNPKPYLRVYDVQWGAINVDDLPQMDFPPDAQRRYRLLPGDLLVNEGGSYVGRSAIWQGALDECYYQKALHRLRPVDIRDDAPEYLLLVMEMATKRNVFVAGGNQTTIDHLTAEQLRRYRFAFPPLEEQSSIVDFCRHQLTHVSRVSEAVSKSVEHLQEYRSALITSAVTGQLEI